MTNNLLKLSKFSPLTRVPNSDIFISRKPIVIVGKGKVGAGEIVVKLSTKGRYGVAAMYDLALHYGQGAISLKSVAQRQGISEHYLEQLMGTLRKAGYVKSVRGAQGGYALTKEPAQISVGDIIRVMEGPIAPVDCLLADDASRTFCSRVDICVTRGVWAKVRDSITSVLDSITLDDLCKEEEEKKQGDE